MTHSQSVMVDLTPLTGHAGAVHHVACARLNGQAMALTAGEDGTVRAWNLEDAGKKSFAVLPDHGSAVTALACGSGPGGGGLWAIAGGADGSLRAWDLENGKAQVLPGHRPGPVRALASLTLPGCGTGLVAAAGEDALVRVWDLRQGTAVSVFEGHDEPVWSVACCVSGQEGLPLAVSMGALGSACDGEGEYFFGSRVQMWNLLTGVALGQPLDLGELGGLALANLAGHPALALYSGNRAFIHRLMPVASSSSDGPWLDAGQPFRGRDLHPGRERAFSKLTWVDLATGPALVCEAYSTAWLWPLDAGDHGPVAPLIDYSADLSRCITATAASTAGPGSQALWVVASQAASPDGEDPAVAESLVQVLDLDQGGRPVGPGLRVAGDVPVTAMACAVLQDGRRVAVMNGGRRGAVRVWPLPAVG